MNYPDNDPLDSRLDQALHSASHSLKGETFRTRLAARIATQQRRMTLVRLLPAGMGLLSAIIVFLVARPEFDFQSILASLASVPEYCRPEIMWLFQPLPGTQNLLFLWVLLAGMALIFSHWLANRQSAIFRL